MKRNLLLQNVCLVFASILLAVLIMECGLRVFDRGPLDLLVQQGGNLVDHHFKGLYAYDAALGWVPWPNISVKRWGTIVRTLDDGIRSNGKVVEREDDPILVVGGSFAFGDEVADDQTWAAVLQEMTGQNVLNAGVSSYGLDQSILRAEPLVERYNPRVVIISVIYESFERISQSLRHGVPKPYFRISGNELKLENVPVPLKPRKQADTVRRLLRHSRLAHYVMSRLFPEYWWKDSLYEFEFVENDQERIAELLFDRMGDRMRDRAGIVVLFLGGTNLSEKHQKDLEPMMSRLQSKKNFLVVNVLEDLLEIKKQDPGEFESLYVQGSLSNHLSAKGNCLVASKLNQALSEILK